MLNVGIVGLGRLGQRHAERLALHTPGARLVAACTVDAGRTLAHGHKKKCTEVIGTEGSDADRRSDHEVAAKRPGGGSGVRPGFDRLADVTRSG